MRIETSLSFKSRVGLQSTRFRSGLTTGATAARIESVIRLSL